MRTVQLKVDNSRIQDSIESASLKVTSPTGKTLTLYKRMLINLTDEERDVFWKFCQNPMVRFVGTMEATIEEMEILKQIAAKQ